MESIKNQGPISIEQVKGMNTKHEYLGLVNGMIFKN